MAKPFRASLLPKPRIFLNRAGAPSASVLSTLMKKPRAHGAIHWDENQTWNRGQYRNHSFSRRCNWHGADRLLIRLSTLSVFIYVYIIFILNRGVNDRFLITRTNTKHAMLFRTNTISVFNWKKNLWQVKLHQVYLNDTECKLSQQIKISIHVLQELSKTLRVHHWYLTYSFWTCYNPKQESYKIVNL